MIGNAVNLDVPCQANSVLALMINPSFGAPSFVARLLPVHCLKADFHYEQIETLVKLIHEAGGYVYAIMSDNLSVNQKMFTMFHQNCETLSIFSIKHPVINDKFSMLYLMYDPAHLFKNIRNNWVSEKTQILKFREPGTHREVTANWKDLISVYKEESNNMLKLTKLDHQTLWPNNFE